MDINIGITAKNREQIARALARVQADTYTLCLKTQNFHWNVSGPMFPSLHPMFEQQYNELWRAADALAERIRALGMPAPGTYRQFAALSSIKEEEDVPRALEMIQRLVEGHETVARTARNALDLAEEVMDPSTCDLLTQRMQSHEKAAWMLRSVLEEAVEDVASGRRTS